MSLENLSGVKEEFQDEFYPDNKVSVSETAVTNAFNIGNTEINEYMTNDKIGKYKMSSVDIIKTDLPSSEVNDTVSNNVKRESGICPTDIQIKFCNELLFCNHCHEVYQDYCTECRVLVYILNTKACNTYNRVKELPKYMLEIRHLGIFSLKVIPEDVRFGPFTGLTSTGSPLRIRGGRFVVNDDKLKDLNWMQYINPARNIYEQNLFPYKYEDELYYYSTRRIEEDEELLVYFGKEYEDNILKIMEMDFVPITKKDVENVFACIFCCLGFRSKEYLAEHKAVCHSASNEMHSVEELVQCPFCKIYFEAKEYFEHHKDYCCKTNDRDCGLSTPEDHKLGVKRCSSLRSKTKPFFRRHTNKHYEVKMYKCAHCHRRYKAEESLKAHVGNIHVDSEGGDLQTYSAYDCFRANIENIKEKSPHSHDDKEQCHSRDKCHVKTFAKIKHLNRGKYKCAHCEFKTNYRAYLERHMKIKHLVESNYECTECEFKGNCRSQLTMHKQTKHLKIKRYKCTECEFKTHNKSHLNVHKKVKHIEGNDYKCEECEFKTNYKSSLKTHKLFNVVKHSTYHAMSTSRDCGLSTPEDHKLGVKRCSSLRSKTKPFFRRHTNKHYEVKMYKCAHCHRRYKTEESLKAHVENIHVDSEGGDLQTYSAYDCFKANIENIKEKSPHSHDDKEQCHSRDKCHVKTFAKIKHLNRGKYKCAHCEFKTNYRAYLERHMKIKHLVESNYECAECEFKTHNKSHLNVHIQGKHLKGNDYKCTECEFKTNYKSHLNVHIQAKHHTESVYKCAECEFKTNYKSHLNIHIQAKHQTENVYKCAECEFKTNYKTSLQEHIRAKHLKGNDYKCAECGFKTNYKSHLNVHIQAKHHAESVYKCAECEFKTNYKTSLQEHIRAKHLKGNDYKCEECEFKTNYKSSLRTHIKAKHLTENCYECSECEFRTNYKTSLERHIQAKHMTNYKSHLNIHIQAKHLTGNYYKCAECGFKTNYKANLQVHIKAKHLTGNDYKCTMCEFRTKYKSHLNLHLKTKHLRENDYKCAECKFKTNYKAHLNIHMKRKHLKGNYYKCAE